MIPLKVHNVFDYILGAFLLVCPSLFGFTQVVLARNFFWIAGVVWIGYSLVTRYYYSLANIISVKTHMVLDAILGVLLILAPYGFGYVFLMNGAQMGLHYVLGFGLIAVVLLTDKHEVPLPNNYNTPATPVV